MTIWVFALFLFAMFASAGQFQGGIRTGIQFIGALLAALLAGPLSFALKPIIPLLGFKNPVWAWALAPTVTFVLLNLVFASIAFAIHHKIEIHYNYKAADDVRLNWERINNRLGICLGVALGGLYVLLIGLLIYPMGYFMTQVKNGKEDPMSFRILSQMTADMKGTGLDRLVLSVCPVGEKFYQTADLVGLLYQNPDLRTRLADYPLFCTLEDRGDFQAIAQETNFLATVNARTNFLELLKDEKIQGLMNAGDLQALYHQLDLKDVLEFARTGKSPLYEKEKFLGRWQLDLTPTTQAIMQKRKPSVPELRYLKSMFTVMLKDITLVASADNKIALRGSAVDTAAISRYLNYKLPPNVDPRQLSANFSNTNAFKLLAGGTWKAGGADTFTITIENLGETEASIKGDRLTMNVGNTPVVFGKVD